MVQLSCIGFDLTCRWWRTSLPSKKAMPWGLSMMARHANHQHVSRYLKYNTSTNLPFGMAVKKALKVQVPHRIHVWYIYLLLPLHGSYGHWIKVVSLAQSCLPKGGKVWGGYPNYSSLPSLELTHIHHIDCIRHFLVDDFPFARVGYEIVPCRETHLRTNRVTYHQYTQKANHIPAWQFCVAFLGWLSDPPDVSISDLQVGDQKVTLNNWLVKFSWKQHVVGGWTSPFEKYARQIGSFPPILGLNKKKEVSPSKNKKILKSPPSIGMVTVTSLTPIDIQQQHQCVFFSEKTSDNDRPPRLGEVR